MKFAVFMMVRLLRLNIRSRDLTFTMLTFEIYLDSGCCEPECGQYDAFYPWYVLNIHNSHVTCTICSFVWQGPYLGHSVNGAESLSLPLSHSLHLEGRKKFKQAIHLP